MPHSHWISLKPCRAALWLLVGSALFGQESAPTGKTETRHFAVPPGTLSVYGVDILDRPDTDPVASLRVTACRPAGEAREDVALLFRTGDASGPVDSSHPLVFVKVRDNAGLAGDRRGDVPPSKSLLIGALFPTIMGPSLRPGARWTQEETSPFPYLPMGVVVQHSVQSAGEGKLRIQSRTTREKKVSTLGHTFHLLRWERDLRVDDATGRVLEAEVELHFETGRTGEALDARYQIVRARELEHRALVEEELGALPEEIAKLREVDDIIQGRTSGAGGFLSALLGSQKKREAREALEILDAYAKTHEDGLLAAAAGPWRERAETRVEYEKRRKEEEARIAELIGSKAPDFTLEDLDGNKVSLSDYRGKVVLLAFWGYG